MLYRYLRLVLFVALACLLVGFVLPFLFSAKSTFAVLVGLVLAVLAPVFCWRFAPMFREDIQQLKQLFTTDKKHEQN